MGQRSAILMDILNRFRNYGISEKIANNLGFCCQNSQELHGNLLQSRSTITHISVWLTHSSTKKCMAKLIGAFFKFHVVKTPNI
jgi:hypothetical protein